MPKMSSNIKIIQLIAYAMKVIRGDYGVGQERKDRLGAKYQPIQNRVNDLNAKVYSKRF